MSKPIVIDASFLIELLEETEELLEALSSEIPIQSPKRRAVEQRLKNMRVLLSKLPESLQGNNPKDARPQGSET